MAKNEAYYKAQFERTRKNKLRRAERREVLAQASKARREEQRIARIDELNNQWKRKN